MRLALLADVHANLPALQAVLAALADASPDVLVCLGDLVGYNAEPAACVDLLKARGVQVVAGNHDLDVATSTRSMGTAGVAAAVQDWTRAALGEARCQELAALPRMLRVSPDAVAVHGSFLNETHVTGYVTSTMLEKNLHALRGRWSSRVGFCGHTHAPMIGWLDDDGVREVHPTLEVEWPEHAEAVLINPGSVGQPRDHNPWSSFAIVDLEARRVRFERVPYDVAAATAAIDRAGLPQELAARLREGR